jgi:branched-chain amino acid transport system substrate-binding protein
MRQRVRVPTVHRNGWKPVTHLCRAALAAVCLVLSVAGVCAESPGSSKPYKVMLDDRLQFTGHGGRSVDPAFLREITIGLYSPPESADPVGRAMIEGAGLAVEEANARGGCNGVPFRLVRRWAENPWSAGSKEMVRLAYEDNVSAVIGFLQGTSNIAEQIAAKAYLPVVSPVSTDSSLTHARIPWIFRLPPDIRVQAHLLVTQGMVPLRLGRVGLVTSTDHDDRMAAEDLRREMEGQRAPPAFHLPIDANENDQGRVAKRIVAFSPDGLVLCLHPKIALKLGAALKETNVTCPIFVPWIPGLYATDLHAVYEGTVLTVEPFEESASYIEFRESYRQRFGSDPSPSAAYAYDAARLIVAAARKGDPTRSGLRSGLAAMSGFDGVTGSIRWDNGGGNKAQPVLRVFSNEMP